MIQLFSSSATRSRSEAPGSTATPRRRRRVALLTAATLALSGVGLGSTSAAYAAPTPQQIYEFSSPSGEDWIVPAGITEVLVGLQGGTGGFGDRVNGGRGADFAVTVPVTTGDRLTVYAGQRAHGSGDQRKGGAGYVNGGDGGKSSLSGANGGGGGGAAAVKLNGTLIAVAAGGGGGGGYSGHPAMSISLWGLVEILAAMGGYKGEGSAGGGFSHVAGGKGGDNASSSLDGRSVMTFVPTSGEGKHPGKVGENGQNDPKFPRYMKSGSNGGSASTSTSGGGGGGGGGGWPASGTGGGGGRKFLGYSAGSGGGTGVSWVTDTVPGVRIDTSARRPEDMHDYFGPLANAGTVRVMIPMTSTTALSAPPEVISGEQLPLRVRTADTRTPNTPLDGWVDVYLGNTRVAYGSTDGDHTFSVPAPAPGTYEYRAEFRPHSDQRDYRESSTFSSSSTSVTVVAPTPAPVPGPSEVTTTTRVSLQTTPTTFGDLLVATATVEPDGPANLSGQTVTFEIDGVSVGEFPLLYVGEGRFVTLFPLITTPAAGAHELVTRFAGLVDEDPATTDVLPSISEPAAFTVAQAATTTAITTAPSTARAFAPADVAGSVTAEATGLNGQAVLLADGRPLMYTSLDSGGAVLFDDVVIPWGTDDLEIAFLGDDDGNFAMSTSTSHAIEVTSVETVTTLALSSSDIRADEPVTLSATVTTTQLGVNVDPRGAIEFVFDGEVIHTVPAGMDSDPEVDDGEARFEIDADTLPIGVHGVTARFVPAPGFGASESDPADLNVRGIATVLTSSAATATGTTADPASVDLTAAVAAGSARLAAPGDPVEGHVEAYIAADPTGDAVEIVDGAGTLTFAGLPVGAHEVELRFIPEAATMLESSTIVTVTVAEADGGSDADGGGGDGSADDTDRADADGGLASTGGDSAAALMLALTLIVGAAVMFSLRRIRGSRASKQ